MDNVKRLSLIKVGFVSIIMFAILITLSACGGTELSDAEYDLPTNLYGVVDSSLSSIELPTGFAWNDDEEVLKLGENDYLATYTPEDTTLFNEVTDIKVSVMGYTVVLDSTTFTEYFTSNQADGDYVAISGEITDIDGFTIDKSISIFGLNDAEIILDRNSDSLGELAIQNRIILVSCEDGVNFSNITFTFMDSDVTTARFMQTVGTANYDNCVFQRGNYKTSDEESKGSYPVSIGTETTGNTISALIDTASTMPTDVTFDNCEFLEGSGLVLNLINSTVKLTITNCNFDGAEAENMYMRSVSTETPVVLTMYNNTYSNHGQGSTDANQNSKEIALYGSDLETSSSWYCADGYYSIYDPETETYTTDVSDWAAIFALDDANFSTPAAPVVA